MEAYLEKIKEIEKDAQFLPDSYESFKRGTYLDKDLNSYTQELVRLEQQLKKKDVQDSSKRRAFNNASAQAHPESHVCQDRYSDCH